MPARGASGAKGVRALARAKLNLGLAVGPMRPDGFHELATIFQSISLADTLTARRRARGFSLHVRHERFEPGPGRRGARAARSARPVPAGRRLVPSGSANLVLRAARLFVERTGVRIGADFRLVKRIPARAGLGGGSADAAAALRIMERLSGVRLGPARSVELAAELGSDVPFALRGGTALGLARGERLRRLRLVRPFRALVVVPRFRVSTAEAFHQIDRNKIALTRWASNLRSAQLLGRGPIRPNRAMRLGNSFEEVLGAYRGRFLSLRDRMIAAGAEPVLLSGSGSALFGILPHRMPSQVVTGRLAGDELRFVVSSARAGLQLKVLP